ncbi:hypothetical protein GOODEAATRI_004309 [Goodea atripinnis]|uniref:Uncharacterized protein n=1 Tax=Goodea atripinnis TaxID=208336 RepID=A0ABV0PKS6_9TELE
MVHGYQPACMHRAPGEMKDAVIAKGLLPVVWHHASDSGASSAADDPILYAMTLTSTAGCPGPTRGPVTNRNAHSCRTSCNNSDES